MYVRAYVVLPFFHFVRSCFSSRQLQKRAKEEEEEEERKRRQKTERTSSGRVSHTFSEEDPLPFDSLDPGMTETEHTKSVREKN